MSRDDNYLLLNSPKVSIDTNIVGRTRKKIFEINLIFNEKRIIIIFGGKVKHLFYF